MKPAKSRDCTCALYSGFQEVTEITVTPSVRRPEVPHISLSLEELRDLVQESPNSQVISLEEGDVQVTFSRIHEVA